MLVRPPRTLRGAGDRTKYTLPTTRCIFWAKRGDAFIVVTHIRTFPKTLALACKRRNTQQNEKHTWVWETSVQQAIPRQRPCHTVVLWRFKPIDADDGLCKEAKRAHTHKGGCTRGIPVNTLGACTRSEHPRHACKASTWGTLSGHEVWACSRGSPRSGHAFPRRDSPSKLGFGNATDASHEGQARWPGPGGVTMPESCIASLCPACAPSAPRASAPNLCPSQCDYTNGVWCSADGGPQRLQAQTPDNLGRFRAFRAVPEQPMVHQGVQTTNALLVCGLLARRGETLLTPRAAWKM